MRLVVSLVAGAALAAPVFASELVDLSAFDAGDAEIVILGEVHDNPQHHAAQAELVAQIGPSALVFEMFTRAQAETARSLGPEVGAAAMAEVLNWSESGWPDFAMYHPIVEAGGAAAIYGAALPRAEVRRVFEESAAEVFGPDAELYGLDEALAAPEQADREAAQMAAHCNALPQRLMPGMVAAQRLRDAHIARVALRALDETGGPVVVITGNGHARTDRGVPAALSRARPGIDAFSLGQFEAAPEPPVPFDAWRVTDAIAREDPCAAFE